MQWIRQRLSGTAAGMILGALVAVPLTLAASTAFFDTSQTFTLVIEEDETAPVLTPEIDFRDLGEGAHEDRGTWQSGTYTMDEPDLNTGLGVKLRLKAPDGVTNPSGGALAYTVTVTDPDDALAGNAAGTAALPAVSDLTVAAGAGTSGEVSWNAYVLGDSRYLGVASKTVTFTVARKS